MITIGRKDRIDLPELGLFNIKAKIDTGAYGCALHCDHIEIVQKKGEEILSCRVLDPAHPKYKDKLYFFKDFNDKLVKNSSGETEHRYTVKTGLIIFNKERRVEFSLTDRNRMKYPVLLGRKFLKNRFLVDVRLKDLSFERKK
ncbi:MAG: RimK/LysX family protein [Bacteroidetes bacterium]|nr:RimK/LysX family protein [Bacteroidota bacterium]MDA1121256.1 RimK/LysX family protein [Bacteroidota bacterium]